MAGCSAKHVQANVLAITASQTCEAGSGWSPSLSVSTYNSSWTMHCRLAETKAEKGAAGNGPNKGLIGQLEL